MPQHVLNKSFGKAHPLSATPSILKGVVVEPHYFSSIRSFLSWNYFEYSFNDQGIGNVIGGKGQRKKKDLILSFSCHKKTGI